MKSSKLIGLVLLIAIATTTNAQQGDISTHRPGFSGTPTTVGQGVWQGEFGYLYTDYGSSSDEQAIPQTLLRYGFRDDMEVQINWGGYVSTSPGGRDGIADASVGVKMHVTDPTSAFQAGFLASLSLPIGGNDISSDSYDPTVGFLWTYQKLFGLYGTAALTKSDGDTDFNNGIGISFPIGVGKGLLIEHQMSVPEHGGTSHQLNTGFTWLQSTDTQFDAFASLGLNDHAADYSIGVGISRRFR